MYLRDKTAPASPLLPLLVCNEHSSPRAPCAPRAPPLCRPHPTLPESDTGCTWSSSTCRELRAALQAAALSLPMDRVVISFHPGVGTITLANDLTLPALPMGSYPLAIASGDGGRQKIAAAVGSNIKIIRPAGATGTVIEFVGIDLEELRLVASGPGELRLTDTTLKSSSSDFSFPPAISVAGTAGAAAAQQPRVVLTRATIQGFKGNNGGGISLASGVVEATGARGGPLHWCTRVRAARLCLAPPGLACCAYGGLHVKPGSDSSVDGPPAPCPLPPISPRLPSDLH
jgi:hypothetical protein